MTSGAEERDAFDLDAAAAAAAQAEFDEYAHLIEDYSHLAPPSEGELLHGHVVKVGTNELIVDFGHKLEGWVPIEQVIAGYDLFKEAVLLHECMKNFQQYQYI